MRERAYAIAVCVAAIAAVTAPLITGTMQGRRADEMNRKIDAVRSVVDDQPPPAEYDRRGPLRDFMSARGVITYRGVPVDLTIYRGSPDQTVAELTGQMLNAIDAALDKVDRHVASRQSQANK